MDKGLHIDRRASSIGIALALLDKPAAADAAMRRYAHASEQCDPQRLSRLADSIVTAYGESIDWNQVERSISWSRSSRRHLLLRTDPAFPELLRHIPTPPCLLFVEGDLSLLGRPQVAIVGSRKATHYGLGNARDIACGLVAAGYAVTSGLAVGIDGAAHRAALAEAGSTVAVLGAGIDRDYPRPHRALRAEICRDGAVISEFPLGFAPLPHHFPRRNRIISGLSVATIVVEAAARSGSLSTATHALEQNRSVFAVPGSIRNPSAAGCHKLMGEGAEVVCDIGQTVTAIDEIAATFFDDAALGPRRGVPSPNDDQSLPFDPAALSSDEHTVLNCIDWEPVSYDELVDRTGLTAHRLSAILLGLEVKGITRAVAGSCYVRTQ